MPPENSSIGRSYLVVAASSAIGILATLASGVLLARLLSVEDRGLVALVLYWAGFIATIGSLSLPDALIFRHKSSRARMKQVLPSTLFIAGLVTVLTIAISTAATWFYSERFAGLEFCFVIAVFGAFLVIRSINMVLMGAERSFMRFGRLALEQTILPLLYSALLIVVAIGEALTMESVLVVFLISRSPIFLIRIVRYRSAIFAKPRLSEVQAILVAGGKFHSVALVRALADQADKIVVSFQWAISQIAYFAVAYSAVGAAYTLISHALGTISLPMASRASRDEIVGHFAQSLRILSILLIGVMVPFLVVAPLLIPLVFGPKYFDAVLYAQVLIVALLPGPIVAQTDTVLRARGQVSAALRMHLMTVALLCFGWLATGYPDIVILGLAIFLARIVALVATLLTLRGELKDLRLLDCVIWRASDFRVIWQAVASVTAKMRPSRN